MVSRPSGDFRPRSIEAQDHLRRAVDELRIIGAGEEFEITIGGKPVARFVPLDDPATNGSIDAAVDFIEEFGKAHTTGGIGWRSLRDEGRR